MAVTEVDIRFTHQALKGLEPLSKDTKEQITKS